MSRSVAEKRAAFRSMHADGCFVLPNPWDVGSARLLQHLGFEALASTSSGLGWATGRADYELTRDDVLDHLMTLCAAVDLPVNADFEDGFATEPEALAESVRLVVGTGVAGLSIEDRDRTTGSLHPSGLAVERVEAARAAIDAAGEDVLLVARTERLLVEPDEVPAAVDSLLAFAAAGADCLYAPGVRDLSDVATMARAVAPLPLNVLAVDPAWTREGLAAAGARRISVGGSLARVAWSAALAAAEGLRAGSFEGLAGTVPSSRLDEVVAG